MSADDRRHEIVIVRRAHGDHDDGHHGGVWKIAFADFMTAMMCFFLVMWLINAANEQTKASVASYFNPVKLIDRNSARKGLEDIGDGPNAVGLEAENPASEGNRAGSEGQGSGGATTAKNSTDTAEKQKHSDASLFADPYAVLAEIAAESGTRQNASDKGDGGRQTSGPASGASGGEAYRDPFAPDFWSRQVAVPLAEQSAERAAAKDRKNETAEGEQEKQAAEAKPTPDRKAAAEPSPAAAIEETRKAAAEIKQAIDAALGTAGKSGLSVEATPTGVVISVTEELDFGMFEIGSAVPEGELVRAMDKIGAVLRDRPGAIRVSGHTDARPFRSESYDNWRLSSARAQAAYHMLVRAGLDETRVESVSGFADRKLKQSADPLAPANRRIEIELELAR
ncbi:MAG TPA: flagellar motor protein MotB [Mesorhizobium sp.]|jgi:chemotaxis protein MotB|nr:flagellar motor protein MotB [Mesorhizobium sp.]